MRKKTAKRCADCGSDGDGQLYEGWAWDGEHRVLRCFAHHDDYEEEVRVLGAEARAEFGF